MKTTSANSRKFNASLSAMLDRATVEAEQGNELWRLLKAHLERVIFGASHD